MNQIPRRQFIKIAGAAGAGLAAWPLGDSSAAETASAPMRPNILVFLTDDHAQWAQHAYGNAELMTPNMDRLAARGTRMMQAFTTCPVCSPARASFFTGRMPSQHGIHDWLREDLINAKEPGWVHPWLAGQTLISELLKGAGYHTGLIGKWHCGPSRQPQPGFDRWFSHWVSQAPHDGTQQFTDQDRLVIETGQQSPLLTCRALNFLKEHKENEGVQGRPFFLYVSYVDTHVPHDAAPRDLVDQYQAATFRGLDEKFAPCHGRALSVVAQNPARERHRHMEYYGAVSSVDREVGKVLAALEANGQLDNTLIVYTNDHGLNCGQHGIWEKGNATVPQNFLEESVRVSCTVSWPAGGIRQNVTCDDLVNHCDLWATLLEIAGATPGTGTAAQINSPGISYLAQLRGASVPSWRQTLFCEYGNARMARTTRYKLIKRYPYAGITFPDELYDLAEDPRETVNQHDNVALKEIVKDLSGQMDRFFARYTIPGHSGLELEKLPEFTPESPWLIAVQDRKKQS
jgi:choline-sulfatase